MTKFTKMKWHLSPTTPDPQNPPYGDCCGIYFSLCFCHCPVDIYVWQILTSSSDLFWLSNALPPSFWPSESKLKTSSPGFHSPLTFFPPSFQHSIDCGHCMNTYLNPLLKASSTLENEFSCAISVTKQETRRNCPLAVFGFRPGLSAPSLPTEVT